MIGWSIYLPSLIRQPGDWPASKARDQVDISSSWGAPQAGGPRLAGEPMACLPSSLLVCFSLLPCCGAFPHCVSLLGCVSWLQYEVYKEKAFQQTRRRRGREKRNTKWVQEHEDKQEEGKTSFAALCFPSVVCFLAAIWGWGCERRRRRLSTREEGEDDCKHAGRREERKKKDNWISMAGWTKKD